MTPVLAPGDEQALAAVVADAAARKTPLAVEGGGTRTGLGRPMQTAATLSLAGLSGVTLYEPAELVISAKAGTPLADIQALLAENRQRLAFEPPDHRALYGSSGAPTIGAVAAANLSGPRRIQAGAARDSLIGVRAVNGRGDAIKSGGRVMKNVTGYDLVKFLAGSYGTLGVLSEVTFKVLPVAETEATLVIAGLDDARGVAALSAALGSPFSVTGAAHLPGGAGEAWVPHARGGEGQGEGTAGGTALTCIRVDGFADSVADRSRRLAKQLLAFGAAEILEAAASAALWASIRDLDVLDAAPDAPIWRVSVRPGDGPKVAEAIRRVFPARILYDWGGGLVWIAGGESADAGAAVVRAAVAEVGGHAMLVRAPDAVRLAVDVFEPQPAPIMDLTRKLKATFDPAGIFNPGRMYRGI